ncbi:DASH complex subunit Spc34 [Chaetomium sp. MPI-CAGE-AT-0009]|nr:DASH complex subunit Spc34 [Chaetomium sp. MPI-CAGE-AT-0009]
MPFLSAHLEQISISCQGIDSLPFPPPQIFTNALLSNPDITSLIRDTEAHERALFSVPAPPPPPPAPATRQNPDPPPKPSSRRQTVFNVAAGEVTTGPPPNSTRTGPTARRNTAVAAVLGGDLHTQITRRGQGQGQGGGGDVDIEVLLHGAEKLCAVYPLPGALERIPAQRQKYAQQSATLAYYEGKVAEQQGALERVNLERAWDGDEDENEEGAEGEDGLVGEVGMTEEDLRQEEAEVRALEKKKRMLQARLKAIDSDLGGLLGI